MESHKNNPHLAIIYRKIGSWLIVNKEGMPIATNSEEILNTPIQNLKNKENSPEINN